MRRCALRRTGLDRLGGYPSRLATVKRPLSAGHRCPPLPRRLRLSRCRPTLSPLRMSFSSCQFLELIYSTTLTLTTSPICPSELGILPAAPRPMIRCPPHARLSHCAPASPTQFATLVHCYLNTTRGTPIPRAPCCAIAECSVAGRPDLPV